MTEDTDIPVHCGWCGEELGGLGEDHTCQEQANVMAYMATGDPEVL